MDAALPGPEELLAELKFAQRIALHLVRDQELADDVAQEAVIAALARSDVSGRERRAWLSGVVRNLVNNRRRDLRRRREREVRYAVDGERFESVGSGKGECAASVAMDRAEQKALVVNAVMALSEPYRTVIVLRYMEELSPPAIAQELGRSRETVKTQLRRGMAQLREFLDAENGGDGSTWALALLPLAVPDVFPALAGAAAASEAGGRSAVSAWKSKGAGKALTGEAATAKVALGVASVAALAAAVILTVTVGADESAGPSPELFVRASRLVPATKISADAAVDRAAESGTARQALASVADAPPGADQAGAAAAAAPAPKRQIDVVDARTGKPVAGATVIFASHAIPSEQELLEAAGELDAEFAPGAIAGAAEMFAESAEEALDGVMVPLDDNLDAVAEMLLNPSSPELADTGAIDIHEHPGVEEQISETNEDGAVTVSVEASSIVCVQVTAEGYACAALIELSDYAEWPLRVELQTAGSLRIRRGGIDDRAVIAVALTDMLTGLSHAILLESGAEDELLEGCDPGAYRLSARAVMPGSLSADGGADALFEVRQRTIVVEANKPAEVSLFEAGPEQIRVTLTGPGSLAGGLTLRASSVHRGASTSLAVPFVNGEAVVEALSGRPVSLTVLRDGSEVARRDVVCEPGRAEPLEVQVALAAGALIVDTGEYGGALRLSLAAAGDALGARTKELSSDRIDDARRVRLTNIPEGSYQLWWAHGTKAGSLPVEIGAGTSTAALKLSADGASAAGVHAVTLEVCSCALPMLDATLRTASGEHVPIELAHYLRMPMGDAPVAGVAVQMDASSAPSVELFLPPGAYVVSYRGMEFGSSSQQFATTVKEQRVVLHSSAENVEIGLRLRGSSGAVSLLVVESGSTGSSGSLGLSGGDGRHGQMVGFEGEQISSTWLPVGTYRASDGQGRSATFTVLPETDFLELTLR